jgi:hypothetical protein
MKNVDSKLLLGLVVGAAWQQQIKENNYWKN